MKKEGRALLPAPGSGPMAAGRTQGVPVGRCIGRRVTPGA